MTLKRRSFLTGAGAIAAAGFSSSAFAQSVIDEVLSGPRRGAWNDQFDAQASAVGGTVQTNTPIFSQQTVAHVEQAISAYQNIVAQGGWSRVPEQKKLRIGVVDSDVQALRQRLIVSGDLAANAGVSTSFDTYVDAALKRFQNRHGMPADGVMGRRTYAAMNVSAQVRLGQLETNLVRLRSMTANSLGNRYVFVNIPATSIEAVEGDRVVLRNAAVVGKVDRQSPIIASKINEIIINPYWNAPESIVRKDIIPLMRKNPNYLKDNNIRILGPNGEIDPVTIDWSTEEAAKLRFRQDPGKINAMSAVKINFPNSHAVYMHDTPQQSLFTDQDRFYSSGCVRVQNVRDLVTWILRDTAGWDRNRFEQTIASGENTPVPVTNQPAVYFNYISAWSTSDGIAQFRDDIYGLDGVQELQLSSTL